MVAEPGFLRSWDFSFILPSATAVTERSDFGTIRHSGESSCHAGMRAPARVFRIPDLSLTRRSV